jgi:nucleotide-binding universal stress UspA family protein
MILETPNLVADYQKALQETGQKVLANCSEIVRAAGCKADTKTIVIQTLDQSISDAIDDEASLWRADVIVIGTHGRRGFRRLLLGSVAEELIRITSKPVLLIRGE